MLPLMFANDLIFSGYTVDSISCCIDLHCCKLLRKWLDVLPPSSVVWHLYELDLPPLLSKETWDWPERRSKWGVLFLKLLPWICKVVHFPYIEALDYSAVRWSIKRAYPVQRAPALCGVWGRVSVASLTHACAMRGDRDSNRGPSGHRILTNLSKHADQFSTQ